MKMKLAMAAGALAAMLAAGAAGAQGEAPTVVAVQLSEFSYSPTTIELNRGQDYVLRLTNSGAHAHDLSAKAFFQTVSLAPGLAALVEKGDVEVAAGRSANVALTPDKAGSYEMHCTHPMHAMLGMKGKIIVR
jgi:plastocyanin